MAKKELSVVDAMLVGEAGNNFRNYDKLKAERVDGVLYDRDVIEWIDEAKNNAIKKGILFAPGRLKDAIGETQKYINELVANNPKKRAKELERLADKTIIGDMDSRTFANKVSEAKKLL